MAFTSSQKVFWCNKCCFLHILPIHANLSVPSMEVYGANTFISVGLCTDINKLSGLVRHDMNKRNATTTATMILGMLHLPFSNEKKKNRDGYDSNKTVIG